MPKTPKDHEQKYKISDNWKRGKESGYPECCIKHYIWMVEILGILLPSRKMDAVYGENDEEYVQCPKCRIKKLIVLILKEEGLDYKGS